jgi:hypothetical protein
MREQNLARLIKDLPDAELRAARHDAAVGLSLLRPGSPMQIPGRSQARSAGRDICMGVVARGPGGGAWNDGGRDVESARCGAA